MLKYQYFTLDNGLKVYCHEDHSTPIAIVNVLYNVGSRDENPEKTGFAHLFEHLMFRGSVNIPNYDTALQTVGGSNNAFTSPDMTNYYITLPAVNLETGLWLESDRMLGLSFEQEVLDTEKNVVIEEFKQRYLNQPYGDVWLKLRPLAYKNHPYQWATIGKEISHIEQASMEDVKAFFYKFYRPNNATLVIAGNVKTEEVKKLVKKWFGEIPAGEKYERKLPSEVAQEEVRHTEIVANVPSNAFYKVFHMPSRKEGGYVATDLLSDILGRGKSSRLYKKLVKDKKVFSNINAYVTGSLDPGLFVVSGYLQEGVKLKEAETDVMQVIDTVVKNEVDADELTKVQNQAEVSIAMSELELLHRAYKIAFFDLLGDVKRVNKQSEEIQAVSTEEILEQARQVLREENSSTLYYKKAE